MLKYNVFLFPACNPLSRSGLEFMSIPSIGTLNPSEKHGERFYHEQHDFLTWHTVPWFGDSSVEHGWTVDHPYLKSNHQRVQVWIRHQKFTNRSFHRKNIIKKNRSSFPDEQGSTLSTKKRVLQVEYVKFHCWQSLCLSAFPRNTYFSIAKNAKSAMLILFSFQNLKFLGDSLGNDWKKSENKTKIRLVFPPLFYVNVAPAKWY